MKSDKLRLKWRKARNCRGTYRAQVEHFVLVVCRHDNGSFYRAIYRDGHLVRGSYRTADVGNLVSHGIMVERELSRHLQQEAKRMARVEKALGGK
jgi:hypothetical protein